VNQVALLRGKEEAFNIMFLRRKRDNVLLACEEPEEEKRKKKARTAGHREIKLPTLFRYSSSSS